MNGSPEWFRDVVIVGAGAAGGAAAAHLSRSGHNVVLLERNENVVDLTYLEMSSDPLYCFLTICETASMSLENRSVQISDSLIQNLNISFSPMITIKAFFRLLNGVNVSLVNSAISSSHDVGYRDN